MRSVRDSMKSIHSIFGTASADLKYFSLRSSSGRRRKAKLRESEFGLRRLAANPNPSGSGNRDRYNRIHLPPVLIYASSIGLIANP
jgi:hypothetical protein